MADQKPVTRYAGDDWTVGPVTLTAAGRPVDLTGAAVSGAFYRREALDPVATLTEVADAAVGGITVAADRTTGVIAEIWISNALTRTVPPQDRRDTTFFTRLALVVTDSRGRERTYMVVLYQPLDRRSDVPPAPASAS